MKRMETFRSTASETENLRKWIWRALAVSVLFHLGLIAIFHSAKLERFAPYTERLVPRAFTANRVDIDPTLLESDEEPQPLSKKAVTDLTPVELPAEEPAFDKLMDEVRATPAAPELAKPILSEKPRVETTDLKTLAKMEDFSESLNKDLESFQDQVIKDKPQLTSRSLLEMSKEAGAAAELQGEAAPGQTGVPGFSNLDQLLGQAGGLKKGTGPILMPTDLLFDYDKAELRPGAVGSLQKLGKLIQRNPNVTFSIEGHTDSFGSDEYNQLLSEARADAVKQWLVAEMGIAASKIRTKGFGKAKLIASAGGTIEEQQINRRVEIVIQFPN